MFVAFEEMEYLKTISPVDIKNKFNFVDKESTDKVTKRLGKGQSQNSTGKKKYLEGIQRNIFPFTYYHLSITDNDDIKDLLLDKIVQDSKDLPVPEGWFTNKLMTSFDGEPRGKEIFFGEDQTFQKILEQKYAACIDAVFDAPYQVAIDEIWYNVYVNGEYQEDHDHIGGPYGSHFSCIHFLSFNPEIHEPVQFNDPISQIRHLSIELDRNDYSHHWIPDIKEGDFLMFPSYLSHCVKPGKPTPEYPRITIALNFRVLKYQGQENDD